MDTARMDVLEICDENGGTPGGVKLRVMSVTIVDSGHRKVSRAVEVRASAAELFDIVADPYRHGELDGSGTVLGAVDGPRRLAAGARFAVKMKQYGVPYRITSLVTGFDEGRVVEWRHPLGHRWRWELTPSSQESTLVTETFDYSHVDPVRARALELFGFPKQNAAGIEATLRQLQARYPGS
jgi:Polyketide cyclase / dehydrase and lipid transport